MIIIPVKNSSSIDQALKQYKFKVYKTKQLEKLKELQEFTKNSVKKREQNKKSVYLQKKKSQLES
jgi:ribosomal protein S21